MAVKFKYKQYLGGEFGIIKRPYATVLIQRSNKQWFPVEMLVDTGSDYTLLPSSIALSLGVSINDDCKPLTSRGVGGSTNSYLLKDKLKIKIGNYKRSIPVAFAANDTIPPILGGHKCLETFKVTFNKSTVTFE